MKLPLQGAFLTEIIFQADLFLHAVERLNDATDNSSKKDDNIGIWSAIQSILISSSNISKIFWPKRKYRERGEYLRKLLEIDSDNALKNRKFRNIFEHYDDLLDELFEGKNSCSYTDLAINPSLPLFTDSGVYLSFLSIKKSCHRGYNTFNHTLELHGEILDLKSIVDAVKEIRRKCESLFL